jgi:type IV pilus assembly protein PilA
MAPRLLVFTAFVLFSCGGSPKAAQDARPLPSAAANASVTMREPSPEIATYFSVPDATTLVYADAKGLLGSQLGGSVVASVAKVGNPALAKCISGDELALAVTRDGTLGALRFDPAKLDTKSCFEGALTVVAPGIALFGSRELVESAKRGGGSLPKTLALGAGEHARAVFDEKPVTAKASLMISETLFALHVDADMPEANARELTKRIEDSRAMVPTMMKEASSDERDAIAKVLRFMTFRRDGGHVTFAIDLHEPSADQAHDVGAMAALAISGVRKYLLQSKEAEARSVVPVIVRSIVADWERETLPATPRAKKKLQSLPPIPQTVPHGTKYVSSEKEWASWFALKFEMDQPQYYQYEVRAAKDGESADVIARGDLNGDGKTSSFVITIKVKKDKDRTLEIGQLVETDPDE